MSSRQTFKAKEKNHFLIIGAVFVLAILSWRFFPTPGQFVANYIFSPFIKGENALNNLTRSDNEPPTDSELTKLTELEAENQELRTLLSETAEGKIVAGVIARPTALPYDVLLIDKGSNDGIKKDTPVYVGQETVIGFVASVYGDSSIVALVSTPGFTSTVYIYGPNIYTTAVGIGAGVTRIHVPQGVNLKIGNLVVMPSLSRGIYGAISAVDSLPERPEQYGYLTTNTPINSLRYVTVGKRPLATISFDEAKTVVEGARRDFLEVDVPDGVLIDAGDASEAASSTGINATSTETGVRTN